MVVSKIAVILSPAEYVKNDHKLFHRVGMEDFMLKIIW